MIKIVMYLLLITGNLLFAWGIKCEIGGEDSFNVKVFAVLCLILLSLYLMLFWRGAVDGYKRNQKW